MNSKHIFLITILILMGFYIPTKYQQDSINSSEIMSREYDEMLVNATSDATFKLLETTDSYSNEIVAEGTKIDYRNINLNLDAALDRFYKTVYMNLNIEDNYAYQQSIKHRIPIKIALGYDGYYVDYFSEDGRGEQWSQIHKYSNVEGDLVIYYTLGNEVSVTNSVTKESKSGTREQVAPYFPRSSLVDEQTYEKVKSQVINSLIQADLEYYTTKNNEIAKRFGWNMNFDIPYWGNRAINSVAFVAFYQGDGYAGISKVYDSFGYSTSQSVNAKNIYGYSYGGKKLYSDVLLNNVGELTYFENQFEAAISGYSPDPRFYYK